MVSAHRQVYPGINIGGYLICLNKYCEAETKCMAKLHVFVCGLISLCAESSDRPITREQSHFFFLVCSVSKNKHILTCGSCSVPF